MQLYLVQGDTQILTFSDFKDAAGTVITHDQVSAVAFSLKHRQTGTLKVNAAACTITSTTGGPLACQWVPGATDLDTPGTYVAELRVTYTNGKVKRYPEQAGEFLVTVREKLA